MKPFIRRKPPHLGIDITPLMDVMFMLLLFFVLTSAFLQPGLPLRLPESSGENAVKEADITISVEEDGDLFLNGTPATLPEIRGAFEAAAERNPEAVVVVQGDRQVRYGRLFEIIDAARKAGITLVDLAYEESNT